MATSSLIQFLGDTVTDPSGIGGDTSHRRQTETFIAGGAITAGDWVALDTSKTAADRMLYVTEAAAVADGNGLVIGVATATVAAGAQIRVVISGYAEGASVANAVGGAGVPLVVDNTAAGQAVAYAATDLAPPCGVSLEAAAGNLADVWVYKRF
jgi:hypothetical protein